MNQTIYQRLLPSCLAISALVAPILPAKALTEAQVLERLSGVPVFTITDDKGAPLLGSPKKGGDEQILLFFLNPNDAQTMLKQVQTSNPDVGKKARVIVRSMNDAYKVIRENKDKKIAFQIVPSQTSLDSARTLLTAGGKPPAQLPNVPIFFAVSGNGPQDGLLTIEQQGKQFVPFFFEQNDLKSMIDNATKGQPNIAQTAKIQVTNLFQVLDSMVATEKNKPSSEVEKFTFIPSRAAYEWIIKNQTPANSPKK